MYMMDVARTTVRAVLEDALGDARLGIKTSNWSIQGFGMLRRHLPDDWRLNVWDSRFRVPDVSLIHDHPWHFESLVLSGRLRNVRFAVEESNRMRPSTHMTSKLKPGPGGGLLDGEGGGKVRLVSQPAEMYERGSTYLQTCDEVHLSDPEDGCVTLNRRFDRLRDDVAQVFWPVGTQWVSAEPRVAEPAEVVAIVGRALEEWNR